MVNSVVIGAGWHPQIFRTEASQLIGSCKFVHPHALEPKNDGERLPFVFLIFLGGFMWTRVISRTTALMTSMDRHTIFYHQTMDDLIGLSQKIVPTKSGEIGAEFGTDFSGE